MTEKPPPEEWIANLINDLSPTARPESRPTRALEEAAPPTALVVDCGTGETKVIAYKFEKGFVVATPVAKLASAASALNSPSDFTQAIKRCIDAQRADFILVSASAWMRNADQETLVKGNELLQSLAEKGVVSLSRQDRETTEICHSAAPNLG